jgi:hypothetical protein
MSLTEAKFEEQPPSTGDATSLVTDLLLDGVAQFPVRTTKGSMIDGRVMAYNLANTMTDPRLRGRDIEVSLTEDPTDATVYLVRLALNQIIE